MENKFRGTIPGVAFSQFEYSGDPSGFVKFLKELEQELPNIPDIFAVNPQDRDDTNYRLAKQYKALIEIFKKFPEAKTIISDMKKKEENGV